MDGNNKPDLGLVHVYTGDGKGKTTSALGLALRATGHGFKVLMVQFMKGDPSYGEVIAAGKIENFDIIQSGLPTFVKKGEPSKEDLRLAKIGFEKGYEAVTKKTYDIVILDEINVAVNYGLIPLDDVLNLIDNKSKDVELILTGRYAHKKIIEKADLVSEVKEIKHPFTKGIPARRGVDF